MSRSDSPIARCASSLSLTALFVAVLAAPALGQEGKRLQVLDGHNFLSSSEVRAPFVTTFFRNSTGGGVAFDITQVVTAPAGDTLINTSGDLAFLNLGFEFQGALADWVALRVGFQGSARVGTSLEALIGNGVSAVYGYFLGGTFRVYRSEKVYLSATADLTGNSIYDVGILRLIQEVIDTGGIPDSSQALEEGTDKAAIGGLGLAWAASRLVGVRLNGALGIADLFRAGEDTKFSFFAQGAVDLNFHDTSGVPLGLLGFFKVANYEAGATNFLDRVSEAGVEVDYTGHPDFGLGLTLSWSNINTVASTTDINTFGASLDLRYYF